jgi:predicted transcriptional regulator
MKEFIKEHWGTNKQCAIELGVTPATVSNWIRRNPRGILKHAAEIVNTKNTTYIELHGEVEHRVHEITELEPIREGEV